MLNEVSIHEKSCEYRMIRCIYLHCNQMVPFIGMDEHLKESHIYDVIIKPYAENDSISLSKEYFGGKVFFNHVHGKLCTHLKYILDNFDITQSHFHCTKIHKIVF